MHHGAAGEVIQAQISQPAAAPYPVADRHVDTQQPEHGERQHGAETHTLGKGTHNQRRGNNGEGHLEQAVQAFRQRAFQRVLADAGKESVVQTANPGIHAAAIGKRQRVTADQPHQRYRTGNGKTLHQDGQHVFATHQTAIEQAQTRNGHEQHQGGGSQNPGGVTGIQAIGQGQ